MQLEVATALARTALFQDLRPEALLPLVGASRRRRYPRRARVWQLADPASELHAILEGRVHVLRTDPDGAEVVVHILVRGDTAGEPGLFMRNGRRATDAEAVEPTESLA